MIVPTSDSRDDGSGSETLSSLIVTGRDNQERTYIPRGKVLSSGLFIAIIASIGLTLGLALLTVYTGSRYAMISTLATGVITVSSVAIAIIFGVKKHRGNKRDEALRPALYRPNRVAQSQVVPMDNPDQWRKRLENSQKNQQEGFPSPAYYNLTSRETGILDLGDHGHYLKVPHLGQYNPNRGGYCPDDHHLAVRLSGSHIPDEIKGQVGEAQNVEFYFMVFKNLEGAEGNSRNISMHAMALSNYLPINHGRKLSPGQRLMQKNAPGIATTVTMAMFLRVGINQVQGAGALTDRPQKMDISIHAASRNDSTPKFSGDSARFEIAENADVSSMHIVAKMRARTVVVHALILNDENKPGGRELNQAIQQNSLAKFLNSIDSSENLNPLIKRYITNTFTHPNERELGLEKEELN